MTNAESIRNPYSIVVIFVTTLLVGGVLGLHIVLAIEDKELSGFLGLVAIGLLFHILLLFGPGQAHIHIHHWYLLFDQHFSVQFTTPLKI